MAMQCRGCAPSTAARRSFRQRVSSKPHAASLAGRDPVGDFAGHLIGGIVGCIESARAATTDADTLEDLEMAQRTAGRAATLVTALLDVARPGTRDLAAGSLSAVADDVLKTAAPTASQQRIALERVPGDAPEVMADEDVRVFE